MAILLSDPKVSAVLTVRLDAVAANVATFVAAASGQVMAVVKADGFGHGAAAVANTALASGAGWIGVATLAEAVDLRRQAVPGPILCWLNAVRAPFEDALRYDIDVAVPSVRHLRALTAAAARTGGVARVHLFADCGMARDGASAVEWPKLCALARSAQRRGLVRVVGVMGHLGCADHPDDPCNAFGRMRFDRAVEVARRYGLRPAHRHLAATAATLTDPRTHHTMSRIGAGLVGIDPSGTTPLADTLTLRAPVVSVRRVPAGAQVGYGHTWSAPATTTLGLLPLGYADGLPRAASNLAEVSVRGRRCPVVGLISMDQTVVDLGDLEVRVGDQATVFGDRRAGEPTIHDWARWSGTIAHEIVTRVGPRVRRVTTALPAGVAA